MHEFFAKLEDVGLPMNVAQTVGHTQIRSIVLGDVDRQATPAELERMKDMVREAMEAGAIGLSTSLIYPPAIYASEAEIAALAGVAGEYGGRYYTHMRNEGVIQLTLGYNVETQPNRYVEMKLHGYLSTFHQRPRPVPDRGHRLDQDT